MTENLIGSATALFPVRLSTASTDTVEVQWQTQDGSAIGGIDYKPAKGVAIFSPGETEKQIEVIVYGQTVTPAEEKSFFIRLAPPKNAVLVDSLLTCLIHIDDSGAGPVLEVIVPQGKRGFKGEPGMSSYDLAVQMGLFDGTVEEWMAQEANAGKFALRAEQAAVAANIGGKVYSTPSAGVNPNTGVKNGEYFNVRSPNSAYYVDEYLNSNGTAISTGKSYPSAKGLEDAQNASEYSAAIAEAAAVSATIGSGIYQTPEAGVNPVGGVPAGSYYNVRSSVSEHYVDEYRNVAGVPTATGKSYLSAYGTENQAKPANTIFDESGKTQQELNNKFQKFDPQKLLLQNYVKPEHNGDASLALALAIADAKTLGSCTIYGGFFSYSFKSKITIDLLNNTSIDFSDSVMIDTLNVDEVILFTNCKNVKILTNVVIGSATYNEFISNGAAYIYFIKFKNSTNCHQRGGSVSGLRNLIQLYDCNFSSFSENYQKGFLPNVDFSVFINNTNFLTLGSISGGKFNQAYKNFAENTGDVVIKQRDTFGAVTHTNSGTNLHDNGVYGSSEHSSVSFANTFTNIRGSAVKSRGSRNVVFANPSLDVDMGVSITGNGTADSRGANGHGSIGVFNPVKRSRSFGVSVDIQDGLYCRDVIIGFNTINEHLGTTVQTPIRVNAVENGLLVGNIFDEHGADYGITQIATSSKATNKSGVLAFNITSSTKPIARSTYGQYGVHLGNLNGLGVGIQYRFQEKTLSIGNLSLGAPVVDSSSYPCSDMTYIGNSGAATNIASQSSAVVSANKAIVNLIDATALTPLPAQAGLLARDSAGASYISVLIGSVLSWKKITVT